MVFIFIAMTSLCDCNSSTSHPENYQTVIVCGCGQPKVLCLPSARSTTNFPAGCGRRRSPQFETCPKSPNHRHLRTSGQLQRPSALSLSLPFGLPSPSPARSPLAGCRLRFTQQFSLATHIRSAHDISSLVADPSSPGAAFVSCPMCEARFKSEIYREIHLQVTDGGESSTRGRERFRKMSAVLASCFCI